MHLLLRGVYLCNIVFHKGPLSLVFVCLSHLNASCPESSQTLMSALSALCPNDCCNLSHSAEKWWHWSMAYIYLYSTSSSESIQAGVQSWNVSLITGLTTDTQTHTVHTNLVVQYDCREEIQNWKKVDVALLSSLFRMSAQIIISPEDCWLKLFFTRLTFLLTRIKLKAQVTLTTFSLVQNPFFHLLVLYVQSENNTSSKDLDQNTLFISSQLFNLFTRLKFAM